MIRDDPENINQFIIFWHIFFYHLIDHRRPNRFIAEIAVSDKARRLDRIYGIPLILKFFCNADNVITDNSCGTSRQYEICIRINNINSPLNSCAQFFSTAKNNFFFQHIGRRQWYEWHKTRRFVSGLPLICCCSLHTAARSWMIDRTHTVDRS